MISRTLAFALLIGAPHVALAQDPAFGTYGLDFHITPPSYAGCAVGSDASATCANRNPNGVASINPAQWAWVYMTGVPDGTIPGAPGGVGSVEFGIQYDSTVGPVFWDLCTGGDQFPQDDAGGTWPESGTGITVTWPDDCYVVSDNDEGITRVGIITIGDETSGFLSFRPDPRIGRIDVTDCEGTVVQMCGELVGRADTLIGGSAGIVTCGATCPATPTRTSTWGRLKVLF